MASMTRGTALVPTVAAVATLTGQTNLTNLEEVGELDLDDLLVTASDAVYDRLEADGHDPTVLTNAEVFKRTVAWHFLGLLAALGHFSGGEGERSQEFHDRFMGLSDRYYEQARPRKSEGDESRNAGEGLPRVANLTRTPMFGQNQFFSNRPQRRS